MKGIGVWKHKQNTGLECIDYIEAEYDLSSTFLLAFHCMPVFEMNANSIATKFSTIST